MDKDELERWSRLIDSSARKAKVPVEIYQFIVWDAPSLRVDALALRERVANVELTLKECWRRKKLSELEADYRKLVSRWIGIVEKEVPPECFFPYPPGSETALDKSSEKLGMINGQHILTKGVIDVAGRLTAIVADLSNALYQKQNAASFRVSFVVAAVAAVAAVVAVVAAVISLSS